MARLQFLGKSEEFDKLVRDGADWLAVRTQRTRGETENPERASRAGHRRGLMSIGVDFVGHVSNVPRRTGTLETCPTKALGCWLLGLFLLAAGGCQRQNTTSIPP